MSNTTKQTKKPTKEQKEVAAKLDLPVTQRGLEQYAAHPDDVIGRASESKATVVKIPLGHIIESGDNARRVFDEAEIGGLAKNIRAVGLRDAVEVKPRGEREDGSPAKYELVDGARRYRAFQVLAKLDTDTWGEIPAFVRTDDALTTAVVRAAKNHQRVQLTPYEEALDFRNIIDKGATIEQCAELVGKSVATVKARLKILDLPEHLASVVGVDGFTMQHADIVLPLTSQPVLVEKAQKVLAEKDYRGKPLSAEEFRDRLLKALDTGSGPRVVDAGSYQYWGVKDTKKWKDAVAELPRIKIPHGIKGESQHLVLDVEGKLAALKREYEAKQRERPAAPVQKHEPIEVEKRAAKKAREEAEVKDELEERLPLLFAKAGPRVNGFGKPVLRIILDELLLNLPYGEQSWTVLSGLSGVPKTDLSKLHSDAARGKFVEKILAKKDLAPAARLAVGLVIASTLDNAGDINDETIKTLLGTTRKDLEKKIRAELRAERDGKTPKKGPKKGSDDDQADDAPDDLNDDVEE